MELGESEVTYVRLEKISSVLGMKPEDVIAFNDQMVFNISNNQYGGNVFSQIDQKGITETERKLYQDQINLLKEEVIHLKEMLAKILK
jgi:hypothetical protein